MSRRTVVADPAFGSQLRALRTARGLPIRDLADLSRVSRSSASHCAAATVPG